MSSKVKLRDCIKTYTTDQDKLTSPGETSALVRERMRSAGLDLLADTERIDNGRLDIPVFISRCGSDALKVMPTQKQMGKGASPEQAEASAVMEMVERFSFFHFIHHEQFIQATYDEIAEKAMPFDQIAAAVHHDQGDLDRALKAFSSLRLSWTPARNLTTGQERLIPFTWFYEINEFNGPAAGNSIEEAVMQGLAEVVERHVSALVCRGKLETPAIDLDSLKNEAARELVEKFRKNGVRLFANDFSLGMGLPTVGALAYDPSTFPGLSEIVYTAGTATDPEKAFIRAVTEVAQLAGDFNAKANFVASGLPKYTDLAQAEYITSSGRSTPIDTLPNISHENIKVEIENALSHLKECGFEVYALNATHPQLNIPVVYNIIPGAHFRERAVGSSVPFFAAKILAGRGDLDGLAQLAEIYPDAYYIHFHQGQALLEAGRLAEAVEEFELALEGDPPEEDLAAALTYLGMTYKEMGAYKRGVEILLRSAEIDGERRDTFNLLGFCYFKIKSHAKAVAAFEKVLELDPGSGVDYANLGVNYRELGKKDEAVRYFKIALEIDPSLDWVQNALDNLGG